MDRNTESDAYHQERSDARQRAKGQAEETRQALANIGDQKGRDRQQPTNVSQAKGAQDSSRDLRDVQPAHAPGTVGRPMNRRGKGNVDVEEDDIAVGGQSGTSRSPKVVQKNRKNRAA